MLAELGRRHLRDFVTYTKNDYRFNWHHEVLCSTLDDFAAGKIQKLMVFMPPQHGKSELTTRRLPAYMLGKNAELRVAIAAYSSTYSKSFNMAIQRIIDSEEYYRMFPATTLSNSNVSDKASGNYLRNKDEFEIVGHRGSLRVTGVDGGALTGHPVDLFILDDAYQSREAAMSRAINESVWSFYINVAKMRMHNNSQELIVMTRWQPDDIAGRILKAQKGQWVVVKFPAIREPKLDKFDPRKVGEALWRDHMNEEKLKEIELLSPITFQASYQQEPKAPKDVLVYPNYYDADAFPDPTSTFFAGDFGFSADPTATVEMQVVKGARTKVYVKEHLYEKGLSNQQIVDRHRAAGINVRKRHIWDSADEKSIRHLQALGMAAIGAVKGPGSVNVGINELRGCDIYVVGPSPNLRFELGEYQFIVIGGIITNEPRDKHNHLMDAMRYGFTNRHLTGKIRI